MFSTILPMFKHCSTQLCDLAYLSKSISSRSPPTNLYLRQSRPLTFGYCKSHEFVEGLNDCLLRGFSLKNLSWSAVLNIVIFASISLGLEIALSPLSPIFAYPPPYHPGIDEYRFFSAIDGCFGCQNMKGGINT